MGSNHSPVGNTFYFNTAKIGGIMSITAQAGEAQGKCYFCGKDVDWEDYCYGCWEFVCGECDEMKPVGRHWVEEHKNIFEHKIKLEEDKDA